MVDCILPGIPCTLLVVRMEGLVPTVSIAFFLGESGVLNPLLIEECIPSVRVSDPDNLRHCFGKQPEFLFAGNKRMFQNLAI